MYNGGIFQLPRKPELIAIYSAVGRGFWGCSPCGHETVTIGFAPEELKEAESLIRESLAAGCVGLSSGLMYYQNVLHTDELVSLAKFVRFWRAVYAYI